MLKRRMASTSMRLKAVPAGLSVEHLGLRHRIVATLPADDAPAGGADVSTPGRSSRPAASAMNPLSVFGCPRACGRPCPIDAAIRDDAVQRHGARAGQRQDGASEHAREAQVSDFSRRFAKVRNFYAESTLCHPVWQASDVRPADTELIIT